MGYVTLVPNTTITSSWGNGEVRNQVISQFANAAARDSAITTLSDGMYADLADTDSLVRCSGSGWVTVASASAWSAFASPLVSVTAGTYTQGSTTYTAAYQQLGKTVNYRFQVAVSTGGGFTAGAGIWQILLPVAASSGALAGAGSAFVLDSGTRSIPGTLIIADATHLQVIISNSANALDSNGPGTAWATGDQVRGSITYEAA